MKKFNFPILENVSLENYNTYKIKTLTRFLAKPNSKEDVLELTNYLLEENIPYLLLGKGSNVILPDEAYDGVIISLENLQDMQINDDHLYAECGILLGKLALSLSQRGYQGFQYLANIPGSLGGALYGNAGILDHTIYDYLESVEVIRNQKIMQLKKEDIKIKYRYTSFKESKDILLSATFKLTKGNPDEMLAFIKENREKRIKTQPLEYPNAGSTFKNPEGLYAGEIIESLGLKGYQIGGAMVSLKHANFIVNVGNATSKDIKDLISYIKEKALKERNVKLELEQIIIEWK